jgi:MYXO-CTERM domain-containing protein
MLRRFAVIAVAAAGVVALASGCSSTPEDVSQSDDAVDYICNEKVSASIDGIPAYAYCGNFDVWSNNGVDTKKTSGGTGWVQSEHGYGYQCVEFAVRYMHFKWKVSASWGVMYAKQMCTTHPSGVSVTTKPVHGDLVVFGAGSCGADPTAGHVAVVDTVGSSTFTAVQENTAGKYTWKNSCASCFLHAASNKPVVDAGSDAAKADASTKDAASAGDAAATSDSGDAAPATTDAAADVAPPPPPDAPDAGDAAPGAGGCSSSPRSPGDATWLVALAAVLAARRRRALLH